jgi:hypothetical protein
MLPAELIIKGDGLGDEGVDALATAQLVSGYMLQRFSCCDGVNKHLSNDSWRC